MRFGTGQPAGHLLAAPFGVHRSEQETEKTFTPVNHLKGAKATFDTYDSSRSEFAVLGFEYGYSLANPKFLVLWEAQFGDFANEAQVIFDQFLSSGERKWLHMSGLACLLPHGYEGQAPEHSSARLERFLQLCAQDTMQVANCSTPANYFHILPRQMRRNFRKPLILMTPKSLLRHKRATSSLADMGPGSSFHRVLCGTARKFIRVRPRASPDEKIRRVVICRSLSVSGRSETAVTVVVTYSGSKWRCVCRPTTTRWLRRSFARRYRSDARPSRRAPARSR